MKVIFSEGKPVVRYGEEDLYRTAIKTKPLKCMRKVDGKSKLEGTRYYISEEEHDIITLVHAIRPLFYDGDSDKSDSVMYAITKVHREYALKNNLGLFNSYADSSFEFCFLADFINKLNLRSGSIVLTRQHFIAYCNILSQLLATGDVVAFKLVNNRSFLLDLLVLGVRCKRSNALKDLCREWLRTKTSRKASFEDFYAQYDTLRAGLGNICADL